MKKIYTSSLFILILTIIFKDSSGQNLIPLINNRFDLGTAANRWRTLYVNNIDASGKVIIGGTLGVTGTTSLGGLQVKGPATFTGIGSGVLFTDATGALTAGPLTAGQIPLLPYLPLAGGTLSGNISGGGASFNSLTTQSFQVTGGMVQTGSVLTSDENGVATWKPPVALANFWSVTGNTGTMDGTNFIGTTDNVPFTVKVNGQLAGRIDPDKVNTFWGYEAGQSIVNGQINTAVGHMALQRNISGGSNVAVGANALWFNTSGIFNTGVGTGAFSGNVTGVELTALGYSTEVLSDGLSNSTAIGFNAVVTESNQIVLGNSSVTSIGGYANWTNFSDGRYKRNIKQNVPGLDFIKQLQPVTYTLDIVAIESKLYSNRPEKKGPDGRILPSPGSDQTARIEGSKVIHTGFIAQDVEKTALRMGYDFSGIDKPKDDSKSFYGLRYGDFVVPLVKAVQELSSRNDSLAAVINQLQDSLNALVDQMNSRLNRIEQLAGISNNKQNSISALLSSAKLYQNAPNPFSQSTLISFFIPDNTGTATIQITDVNGAIIKSVPVAKGNGQLNLSTVQLSAGVYNYSLYVDRNLIDTKKMVLIK